MIAKIIKTGKKINVERTFVGAGKNECDLLLYKVNGVKCLIESPHVEII